MLLCARILLPAGLLALALASSPALAAPAAKSVAATAGDFAAQALAVAVGGQLTARGLQLEADRQPCNLLLTRFTVGACMHASEVAG